MAKRSIERSSSPAATEAIGARLAERLRPGDVVLVGGELGAGKTTLIRGACRALGVTAPVTSPTFTIGQRYRGRLPISHIDLYRITEPAGEDPALLEDYVSPDGVVFVEWPEEAGPLLDRATATVEIRHAGGDEREIELPDRQP